MIAGWLRSSSNGRRTTGRTRARYSSPDYHPLLLAHQLFVDDDIWKSGKNGPQRAVLCAVGAGEVAEWRRKKKEKR